MALFDPLLTLAVRGVRRESADTPDGHGSALYDSSGLYRYRLSRVWDPSGGRLLFVMLNPSTATAGALDPTVARTVQWAKAWGFGSLEVVNIFALRSTDPRVLRSVGDPIGPRNDLAILSAAACADRHIAAWGVHGGLAGRGAEVQHLLAAQGIELEALKVTRDGHPGHPLYLPGASTPVPWRGY
jgi:hypothetical protein